MQIYLGGKISGLTLSEAGNWRKQAELDFTALGCEVFNPLASEVEFYEDGRPLPFIPPAGLPDPFNKDRHAIKHSDIIVMNLLDEARAGSKGAISRGSYIEMGIANGLDKTVLVVWPDARPMHPFVAGCASFVVPSMEAAVAVISTLMPVKAGSFQVHQIPYDWPEELVAQT